MSAGPCAVERNELLSVSPAKKKYLWKPSNISIALAMLCLSGAAGPTANSARPRYFGNQIRRRPPEEKTMSKILILTGDGGESYETLYAYHRFLEAGLEPVIAAPAQRRLHQVMHDFEPGWNTYVERQGYGIDAHIAID